MNTRTFSTTLVIIAMGIGVARADTFIVTNTNDSGAGSLRQAILDANGHAGADTIIFTIPGSGVQTIAPMSPLPTITDAVTIDGYTQLGASQNALANSDNAVLLIELNGSNLGQSASAVGLRLSGGASTVRGLVINRAFFSGILTDSSGNTIEGNFIGTDATGTAALPNGGNGAFGGIYLETGSNNTIGGTTPGARNLISGNTPRGIEGGPGNNANIVQGNFIGTDASGTKALGNSDGIAFEGSSNVIGGTVAGARNVISGNSMDGVVIQGSNTMVQGNFIGVGANGVAALGNAGSGVSCHVSNNLIGGTTAGTGNIIAFNNGFGVVVFNTTNGNAILGNSIFANTTGNLSGYQAGIHLGGNANNQQNFPVLTLVTNGGGNTVIAGTLNSAASTTFRIEFFANDTIDPTGYGEGKTFLGFTNVTTDASGNVSFNVSFSQIAAGKRVTSTATDPSGNTSEFSGAIGQLLNISTRLRVLTGDNVLIGGFIITGSGNKQVLVRALGPTLAQPPFLVPGVLADPTLDLHDNTGATIASNDNWKDTQQAAITATGLAPPNDAESAILRTLAPGNYTAIVQGKNNSTGVGLVEVYDLDQLPDTILSNISTRGFVNTNDNVMIGGFISGNGVTRVIVRALGPTLGQPPFNVPNVLADPTLELHDANGVVIATNDNWQDTQAAEIAASGFAPPNVLESAIIITRRPGSTTAIVRGANNTTGNALVEAYALPPQ